MPQHNHLVVFKSLASLAAMTDIWAFTESLNFSYTLLHTWRSLTLPWFSGARPTADSQQGSECQSFMQDKEASCPLWAAGAQSFADSVNNCVNHSSHSTRQGKHACCSPLLVSQMKGSSQRLLLAKKFRWVLERGATRESCTFRQHPRSLCWATCTNRI